MKKIFLSLILIIAFFIFLFGNKIIYALPDIAHKEITEMSSDIKHSLPESTDNGLKSTMENFPGGYEKGFKDKVPSANVSQDYPPNSIYGAQHYYDPTTDRGLYGIFPSAKTRANDLYKGALRVYCFSLPLGLVSPTRPWEVFGQSLHLMQDMTTPAHTIMADHAAGDNFESYVRDNWKSWDPKTPEEGKIINPQTGQPYTGLKDYLENHVNEKPYNPSENQLGNLSEYFDKLSKESQSFPKDGIEVYSDPTGVTGIERVPITWEQKRRIAKEQLPKALMYGAGLINTFWKDHGDPFTPGTICIRVPEPVSPAGDHPDDRFDVSDEFYWESEFKLTEADLTDFYMRTAIKKGKIGVWYKRQFIETYRELETIYKDAPKEVRDPILVKLYKIGKKLEQRINQLESDWKGAPDIALFTNGFYNPSISLMLKIGEPVSFQDINFNPEIVKDHPVLLVPTGGFYGLKNSASVKALLDEYVKNGGTLVVFTQQHGYDWELLPTPVDPETGERKPVTGYGYQEDQSCQFNSVYVDTYHPILSVFSTSTANIGVDGYFLSYPDNSTILLRRVTNGQPAMVMYPYGSGYVIATTMYTDFAFSHNQTNQTEINFMQNIISWAKKPESIIEVRPGETVNLDITLYNFTDKNAASVKFTILDPNRKVLSEQTQEISVSASQSITVPFSYSSTPTSALGIYHIDYILYDSSGTIVQPQTETDSGRFVVSNPAKSLAQVSQLSFSIQSESEHYIAGSSSEITFTIIAFNNSDIERTVTAKFYDLGKKAQILVVPAKGSSSFIYSPKAVFLENFWGKLRGTFSVSFFENNKYLGTYSKVYWVHLPSVNVTIQTDKTLYVRGETVIINTSLKNNIPFDWQSTVRINIAGPKHERIFEDSKPVAFSPYGTGSIITSFTLPSTVGTYTIWVETWHGTYLTSSVSTIFELVQSQISIAPNLPSVFISGTSPISFTISNTGRINVSSGVLDLSLTDPEGATISSGSQTFVLAVGESQTLDFSVSIPSLKFGNYALTYTQLDETRTGNPTTTRIPNYTIVSLSFDKPSYRVRETAQLSLDLTNIGKFNQDDVLVTVSVSDVGYGDSKAISLSPTQSSQLFFPIPIPDTAPSGLYSVDVTVAFSSGSKFTENIGLPVPNSTLVIEHTGITTTIRAGDTVNLKIENTGGVDTTYTTEKMLINDSQGVEIYQGSVTSSILAGEKKSIDIQIPSQTVDGPAVLNIQIKDNKTGILSNFSKTLEVMGLTAEMQVRTEREDYFRTESITGISSILNGPFGIENGTLRIVVNKVEGIDRKQFSHFLPKKGWWPLNYPKGVALGPDGSVYVADNWNYRIQKFDRTGGFVTKWGSKGSGDGQFSSPLYVAVGPDGSVYVTDNYDCRIQKFDSSGNFITKWGSRGSGDGQFSSPQGIAVDSADFVYVVDTGNYRVQKFSSDGIFIMKWGSAGSGDGQFSSPSGVAVGPDGSIYVSNYGNSRIQKFTSDGTFITLWGSYGSGDGQFDRPQGIAIDSDGSVYVVDGENDRIQKFDSSGNFITKWGGYGNGNGQFYYPFGVVVGSDGSVYVADSSNDRIQKFDSNGNFLTKWGMVGSEDGEFELPSGIAIGLDGSMYVADTYNDRIQKFDSSGNFITKWGQFGSGDGQFYSPLGVTVGSDGSVYVADTFNHRIQKFDANGKFISKWGSYGSWDGTFRYPSDIAIDSHDFIYVADSGNDRIQKFNSNGAFIKKWGFFGSGDGRFKYPSGIAIGSDDSIYVADSDNHRIQKFDSNGNFIMKWGTIGNLDGQFNSPADVSEGPDGSFYVVDRGNHRIQKFDNAGNFIAKWGIQGSGDGQFYFPSNVAVGTDGTVYVSDQNHRIQSLVLRETPEKLLETIIPITQQASTTQEYAADLGILNSTGKFYLHGALYNNLGQTIAQASYPFYIIEGDILLSFRTDKRVYRMGETVTVTGQVKNFASIDAVGLVLSLTSKLNTQSPELLYTETFSISVGENYPFSFTTIADNEGTVSLFGKVTQHDSTLVEIIDQYEVAKPNVSVSVTAPDVTGNELFNIDVQINNTGKVEATVQFGVQSSEFGDSQTIVISAGETKLLQYSQQISKDMTYTFTFTGDIEQTITKTVFYGLGASIQFGVGSSELGIFPEGRISIPVTVVNSGQLNKRLEVSFQLSLHSSVVNQQSKTYYLPKGGSAADTLYFDLTEGDYQVTASSQLPSASAQSNFSVRKENKVEMAVSLGTQTNGLIPVTINLANLGYNTLEGSIQLSVINAQGVLWNGEEALSQLSPQNFQLLTFNINPSVVQPGDYILRAELLSNSGQSLAFQSLPLTIKGSIFQITQTPSYQFFYPGQEATFIFRVKNTGNQEGPFDLRLKAYDLIDSTQREWLKPGEEKPITFGFFLPEDLEEKDYFATYELKNQDTGIKGQVKYHLSGISLNVNASLDKPYYREGETAHLTINIQSPNPNPQSLFSRAQYNGYEDQRPFTLSGNQTLLFDIPLTRITGEKLFYGIYYESGRSIHLNSLYIHKAGEVLTIETDKQVYNPSETVAITVSSQPLSVTGTLTLTAPNYIETFPFAGTATKSFTLSATIVAGTYYINAQLEASNPGTIAVSHPFDVTGIQVKILECHNDKGKYASTDTITTNFTIFSNTTMPAILKAWIVDPKGQYTSVGENNLNLSSSENSLLTRQSSLATSVSGIHRLTYGIYTGDLFLASGSEAFDVGDAVLLGLSTGKTDYPEPNEPVNVKVNMYGTVDANLELQIDGNPVGTQAVGLNGFSTLDIVLATVKPGVHALRGVLTAGGLRSTREATFVYGSSLPDLTVQLSRDQAIEQSSLKLTITAINQGKTLAGATTLNLYDGIIATERPPATLDVNGLAPGESQTLTYNLNLLGRSGTNTIYAVIDPADTVVEFNETNNEGQITFTVPELTLSTILEKDVYSIGNTVVITGLITNLSKASTGITLTTTVKNASGTLVFTDSKDIPSIAGQTTVTINVSWVTGPNLPEGVYTISQTIKGKDVKTQKTITIKLDKDFTITSDVTAQRVEIGEAAQYNLTLTPVRGFVGEISLSIIDCPQGFTAFFTSNPVSLSGTPAQLTLKMIPTSQVKSGSYTMRVNAGGGGRNHDLTLKIDLTDFQMSISPTTQTIQQLDEATYTITLTPVNGFDSLVTLEVGGVPRNMKADLSTDQVTLPQNVTLTLTTSKWLLLGSYTLTITAKGRAVTHTATATLVVEKNPVITPEIVTAPGPGPKNKPIINIFRVDGALLSQFQAFDTKYGANLTAGDVDGDGIDEIIVGTVHKNQKNPALLGIFKKESTKLAIKETEHRDKRYGITVATGDIDGDWTEEVAVGYYTGELDDEEKGVYGKDSGYGTVKIYQYTGGQFIDTGLILFPYEKERYERAPNISLADVDGDGVPELITAPGPDPNVLAKIKVFKIDTKDGIGRWKIASQLAEFTVPFEGKEGNKSSLKGDRDEDHKYGYGANIAAGDIDGDGRAEIIVGAGPDPKNTSLIKVYRGDGTFTGVQFTAYPDPNHGHDKECDDGIGSLYRYGVYVAVGDIDEDGISEIITGTGPDPKNDGWVRMFKGDGTPIGSGFLAYPADMRYGIKPSGINMGR